MKVELPAFNQARVLVVGDVMLDKYWQGTTDRISPESPVPIVNVDTLQNRPGGAANVALNIASLGGQATLIGITGEDEASDILKEQLSAVNVTCIFQKYSNLKTIVKLRVISRNQQLLRIDFEDSFFDVEKKRLFDELKAVIAKHDVLVLSDYNKGTLSNIAAIIALAKENNIPVFIDPKNGHYDRYKDADYLTPNTYEFEQYVGSIDDENDLIEKAQTFIEHLHLKGLLITRSEKGMTLIRENVNEMHLPAHTHEVFDVTGAGDTVIATLALALAANIDIEDACVIANVAAGLVVEKMGTSSISEAELLQELTRHTLGAGALSQEQLKIAVDTAKSHDQKIVMTNGCFDILHAGHVSYLENAKKLGDKLIVAVNDDESVKRLKGKGRPVNRLERRMAVLAGLAAVDWVVSFSEDTPQQLISSILPHILVKGGDYQVSSIAGGEEVLNAGGEVRVLNFETGISTTEIIQSIKLS